MKAIQSIFIRLIKTLLLMALALLTIGLAAGYYNQKSEQQAKAYCSSIKLGDSSKGLLEKGLAVGADKRHSYYYKDATTQEESLAIAFKGLFIDRHYCGMTIKNETITSKKLFFLD
ncbi:hypothetical protein [uncultured Thiothrix sp.]|uniref:hypothetical protein n=1 Tax=uncultured Thiothrix sp. TaxID=223185 RepID=UPI002626BB90|nr:hypothetical protein [uncultured Thiothrix sp.]